MQKDVLQALIATAQQQGLDFKPDEEKEIDIDGEKILQIRFKTKSGKSVKMQEPNFSEQWDFDASYTQKIANCITEFTVGDKLIKKSDYLPEDWVRQIEKHFPARESVSIVSAYSYLQELIFR